MFFICVSSFYHTNNELITEMARMYRPPEICVRRCGHSYIPAGPVGS